MTNFVKFGNIFIRISKPKKLGGAIMDALKTVFETIKEVLAMIQKFFNEIMGMVKPEDEEAAEDIVVF